LAKKLPTIPGNSINDRAKIIASICFVDYVITLPLIKDNKDYQSLVIDLKPAIIATTEGDLNRRYKEEQAKKTFELYKKYGTNPFSGCLVILLQLPVIFALYYVFYKGLSIDSSLIYSFIQIPTSLHTNFLGLIEMGSKSIFLGLLAGVTQFIQGYLSTPIKPKTEIVKSIDARVPKTFQEQLSDSMQMNVRYILPVFIAFIAWKISAAVALYWILSNIFTIVQEWYIRRQLSRNSI